jgi:vitamin B12 transporter
MHDPAQTPGTRSAGTSPPRSDLIAAGRPRPVDRRGVGHATMLAVCLLALGPVGARAQEPDPDSVVVLDPLRVSTGSRVVAGAAAVTRSVDVLGRREIDALPARSLGEVVGRLLGVDLQARSPAQADVSIRGAGFEQVLVLVDGVPVNDEQTGHFHLNLAIPLDAVERIEVLRGPASALYGSAAVGGVIHIVTRRSGPELAVRARAGTFGSAGAGADAGFAAGRVGLRVSAERDQADGHRPGTDHVVTLARLAMDLPLGSPHPGHGGGPRPAGGTLRANVAVAARDFGAAGFYAPFDSYEETRTVTATLGWSPPVAPFTLEPRLSFRRHGDDFILRRDDPGFYRNVHETRQTAAEIVARWRPAGAVTMAAGGEAGWSALRSPSLGDRDEDRLAIFGEVAAGHPDRTLLTAGARLDRHDVFGSSVSPTVAVGHSLGARLRVRASFGAGFRAPSWTERFYRDPANIGTPDLEPERFRTGEAGLELRLGNRDAPLNTSLDLAGFVRRAADLIDWARPVGSQDSVPWRTLNVERATFRGLETTLRTRLLPGGAPDGQAVELTGRAAVLAFDASAADGLESKYALRPITRTGSAELGLPLSAEGGARAVIRFGHHRRAGGPAGAESWHLLDARVSRGIRGIEFHLDATNLLDTAYADIVGQPAPGRALGLGARARLGR